MKANKIGCFIRKGMSTSQIRSHVANFPSGNVVKYLETVGYTHRTALLYNNLLNSNNRQVTNNIVSNVDLDETCFFKSANANVNNLLLDTCALQNEKTIALVEKSNSVTVLLATIKEMDSLKYSINKKKETDKLEGCDKFLLSNISKFGKKFLSESKYRLVPFDVESESYTDSKILKYITCLPMSERPTLLTSDILFAATVKCLGLDYILYVHESQIKEHTVSEPTSKEAKIEKVKSVENFIEPVSKLNQPVNIIKEKDDSEKTPKKQETSVRSNLGVTISFNETGNIQITRFNPNVIIMYVTNLTCHTLSENNISIESPDYIALVLKCKGSNGIKVQKIMMVNNEKVKEEYLCYSINEIYKLENILHNEILDNMKNLL